MAHDSRDYYKLLRLEPGASVEEVNLAYGFLKYEWEKGSSAPDKRVVEAYECLSDPNLKAKYDAKPGRVVRSERSRMAIFGALLVVLLLFAGFVFPGFLRPSPGPYHAGDRLTRKSDGHVLGEVVRREAMHRFSAEVVGPGYLVRMPSGAERWYPADELERHYSSH